MKKSMLVLALLLAACGGKSAPGETTTALKLPSFTVPAGQESLKCFYQRLGNKEDILVSKFKTIQVAGGHHLAGFTSLLDKPDGTETDCVSAQSMEMFRPILAGLDKDGFEMPDGYAVRIPANAVLVWQTHYVNATTSPITTDDEIDLTWKPKDSKTIQTQFLVTTNVDFSVPANSAGSATGECVVPQDLNAFAMFGHMHEWGRHLAMDVGDAGDLKRVYEIQNWQVSYRDKPPTAVWPIEQPMQLKQGQHVKLTCDWDNTTNSPLTFPTEMCVGMIWVFPSSIPIICG